jgi:DNA-binding NarL/FixJ family response regulator
VIRVVIADDVKELRSLIRHSLEADTRFEVVGEAGDGREAVDRSGELKPDVLVLDLSMPVMDGLSAIPRVHEVSPTTRILVFSGFEESGMAQRALAATASAYLTKGAPPEEVVSQVAAVAAAPPKRGSNE